MENETCLGQTSFVLFVLLYLPHSFLIELKRQEAEALRKGSRGVSTGLALPTDMTTDSASSDREVLLLIKHKADGDFWTNREGWDANVTNLNSWFGVTAAANGRVVELKLCTNYFAGFADYEVPRLVGGIPAALGQLSNMQILSLSDNQLTGVLHFVGMTIDYEDKSSIPYLAPCGIPAALGMLSNLQTLSLSDNQLTGGIPAALGQLSNMQTLSLFSNQLTGGIPAVLGQLSNMQTLSLSHNQLTGGIPAELGQLSNMQTLSLSHNQLTGGIPAELGQLSNMQSLYVSYNQLTGSIPTELGQLSNMQTLSLSANQLTGGIPAELGHLSNMQTLSLSDNQLTGGIPAELGQLSNIQTLSLSDNQLTGGIPAELGQLNNMQALSLSDNQLTGVIPAELGQLSNMQRLYLSDNQLTGGIPAELGQLSNMQSLFLSHNQLTGFGDVEDALKFVDNFLPVISVFLGDNPWRMPPEGVVNQGLDAVKTYLKDVKDAKDAGASNRSLELLKVVLVGSSGAGKTSLINSIVNGRAVPTDGDPAEASTVGIELQTHALGKTTVEFYDCAGQLDYAGMHQTFLSKRALYLLVWDVSTCQDLSTRKNSEFDKVIREKIMPWLTILHLRAPNATVMLVANKCERAIKKYAEIADKVEKRARALLDEWQRKRGLSDRYRQSTATLSWLSGRNLISCQDFTGISELVQRISDFGSTSIEVPPSWDLALTFVNALRKDRSPLSASSEHFELSETPPYTARKGKWTHTFVTRQELSCEWQSVVLWLTPKLDARALERTRMRSDPENVHGGELAALSNPESALEGALWISEFAGRILRFDGGDGIFLDAVWLSKVLSPILSHKLESEPLPSSDLSPLRDDLVHKGILRVTFARYLWRNVLDSSAIEANHPIIKGLYRVLLELGVILPLGRTTSAGIDAFTPRGIIERVDTPQDVLVVMRLPKTDDHVSEKLQEICDDRALKGAREVMLKWRFDSAGAPQGFVERLIASCHCIDEVEMKLCWRYGGSFKSPKKVQEDGRPFTFVIRYNEDNGWNRVLSLKMIGALEDDKVWKALRYVASAMVNLSEEWPGVLWEGWSQCPEHPRTGIMYLAPPHEAKIGGPLVPATSTSGCDCSLEENTVQQLVSERLGNVIDTRKGDPFSNIPCTRDSSAPNTSPGSRTTVGAVQPPSTTSATNTPSRESSAPNTWPGSPGMIGVVQPPSTTSARNTPSNPDNTTGDVRTPSSQRSCCHIAFEIWRENAWYFAGSFGGLALTIFLGGTLVGIIEGIEALWIIASIFVGVLALGAMFSSAVACRDSIRRRRRLNSPPTTRSPSLQATV